jgi:large subunit ribosomal protein L3
MSGGPMTHGGHSKRRIGSIGCRSFPGRIHKGKRMPGHMGHVNVTAQNLKVVQLRAAENLLLVGGAVPGPAGSLVVVRKALKKAKAGQAK